MLFRVLLLLNLLTSCIFGDVVKVDRGDILRSITLDGTLKPAQYDPVKAPFAGAITKLLEDGTSVSKGTTLIVLDTYDIENELAKMELEYYVKKITFDKASLTRMNENIDDLVNYEEKDRELYIKKLTLNQKKFARDPRELLRQQLTLRKTSQMIEFYEGHLQELMKLSQQGALSETQMDEERIKFQEYKIRGEELKLNYEKLKDGDLLEIQKANKEFDKARIRFEHFKTQFEDKSQLRKLNEQVERDELKEKEIKLKEKQESLSQAAITASTDGGLSIRKHWLGAGMEPYEKGHRAEEGSVLAELVTGGVLKADFDVNEIDTGFLKTGQKVLFQVLPLGEKWFEGKLIEIQKTLEEVAGWRQDFYRLKKSSIEVSVSTQDPRMKSKMSVLGRVVLDERKNSLRLSHSCIQGNQVELGNGQIREVKTGLVGDSHLEVLEGLKEGEEVRCHFDSTNDFPDLNNSEKVQEFEFFESVVGTGELRTRNEILLSPAYSSNLKKLVASGKEVKEGEVVAILDTKDLEQELQGKEIELTQKEVEQKTSKLQAEQELQTLLAEISMLESKLEVESKQLAILSTGSVDLKVQKVRLQNKRAQLEKQFQVLNFTIQESLKEQGYIKSTEYQNSLESLKDAEINKQINDLELELEQSPASKAEYKKQARVVEVLKFSLEKKREKLANKRKIIDLDLKLAKLNLDLAKLDVQLLNEKIKRSRIKAPKDGVFIVNNHWSQGKIVPYKTGEDVSPGDVIGRIVEFKDFFIMGKLNESAFHTLKRGQEVLFSLSGRKDQSYPGVLTYIAPIPGSSSFWGGGDPVILVEIDTDASSKSFQPGSSVQYEVMLTENRSGLSIPSGALYEDQKGFFVYAGKEKEKTYIEKGHERQNRVEVLKGLEKGQTIYWDEYK